MPPLQQQQLQQQQLQQQQLQQQQLQQQQLQQQQLQQQQEPAPSAGGLELPPQPGPEIGSDSSDSEGAGPSKGGAASLAALAAGNSSGGEGSGSGPPDSTSGGSSGSRRSRGSRERQPCAFFLKTGTCAYGDRCVPSSLVWPGWPQAVS
jgi:hypothetical protein